MPRRRDRAPSSAARDALADGLSYMRDLAAKVGDDVAARRFEVQMLKVMAGEPFTDHVYKMTPPDGDLPPGFGPNDLATLGSDNVIRPAGEGA